MKASQVNNDLVAFSTTEEMNKWAYAMWGLVGSLNIDGREKNELIAMIKYVSDKFVPSVLTIS